MGLRRHRPPPSPYFHPQDAGAPSAAPEGPGLPTGLAPEPWGPISGGPVTHRLVAGDAPGAASLEQSTGFPRTSPGGKGA